MGLIAAGAEAHVIDRPGGIFVRRARADVGRGPHAAADGRARRSSATPRARSPSRSSAAAARSARAARSSRARAAAQPARSPRRAAAARDLAFFNGLGGFTPDGREYVITTAPGPASRRRRGSTCSPTRSSARSSPRAAAPTPGRERARVPPDAVAQRSGQRRERRGVLPPRRGDRPLLVADAAAVPRRRRRTSTRHGFGYSVFEHAEDGIASELCDLRRASTRR